MFGTRTRPREISNVKYYSIPLVPTRCSAFSMIVFNVLYVLKSYYNNTICTSSNLVMNFMSSSKVVILNNFRSFVLLAIIFPWLRTKTTNKQIR